MSEASTVLSDSSIQAARELRVLVSRLRRRFLEASDNLELTPSQLSVLSRLKRGDATASEIAAAERVRPQAIATHLGILIERGFVERRPDPKDGRRQLVSLTDAGLELMAGRAQAGQEWLASALDQKYTEAERQTVLAALDLLERLGPQ
ncbi:MarR family winged helix-turn-helix transcriptional regulator [Nocardia sp. CDC160]|uniref:MarR family winged helix-turn-helix transcriptional regulator n=1 Tax=Nocardia sp. CDC160 TaxID=3112166 RepID=UPI002DBA5098|nr:MarR family transcriptional regulator [Nocardia sp. CDC160]MEC3918146.1 MarR family transcriptional regulator [Nocardia sp. CDC160]